MVDKRYRLLTQVSLSITCLAMIFQAAVVHAGESAALPDSVRSALAWLPPDTEMIAAATSFKIRSFEKHGSAIDLETNESEFLMELFALTGLFDLENGKYIEGLVGRQVVLALRGARNIDAVSKFGSVRDEGCAIVVFEKEIDMLASGWFEKLRKSSKEIRKMRGRDVLVYSSSVVMEHWAKPKPWQGTFIVRVKPDTLLCATSDRYLDDVLRRVDHPANDRALADELPEWRQVDPKSSRWMLRHVPETTEGREIRGLTFTAANDRFQIAYLPVANAAEKVESGARAYWARGERKQHVEVRRQNDGIVIVSGEGIKEFAWALCLLPLEDGTFGAK